MSNMKNLIEFSDQEKGIISKLVKKTAYNATGEDINYFIYYCQLYGLNPITGDAILQKFGKNAQILTTRDGWIKAASQQPGFVGPPISHPIYEGDEVELLNGGTDIKHVRNTSSEKIVGAYAIMHHEKYHSITQTVDMVDYFNANSGLKNNKRKNVWDSYPSAMIVKIAEVFALRRMFPLGQVSTQEEMAVEGNQTPKANPSEMVQDNKDVTSKNNPKSSNASKPKETSKEQTAPKKSQEASKQAETTQQENKEDKQEESIRVIGEQDVIVLDEILQEIVDVTGKDKEILLNSVSIPTDLASIEETNFKNAKLTLEGLLKKAKEKFANKEETPKNEETQQDESSQIQETSQQQEEQSSDQEQNGIVLPEQHSPLTFKVGAVEQMESNQGKPYSQVVPENDLGKVFIVGGEKNITKGCNVKGNFFHDVREGEDFLFLTNVEVS